MHELSLCRAIADAVAQHADGRTVERVRIQVGHFRQVVPDTLVYCWDIHTNGTDLAGSELEITEIPAVIACTCGERTTLAMPVLRCGTCGGVEVRLVSGEEFLIESIDVSDRDQVAREVS